MNDVTGFHTGGRKYLAGKVLSAVCVVGVFSPAVPGAHAQKQAAATAETGDARVDKLLSEMTLDEKISMLHGEQEAASTYQGQAGFLAGVPRLGISSMRLSDGPPGILTRVPAMALTATMGLAATFSRDDARQNGIAIAREAKAHGIDVVLEPFINIDRDVSFRRGYNTFGEDPFLTGEIGAAEIRGIQSQGIMAQAKHYIAFDSDNASFRSSYNVEVEPQAMQEIYLPPFVAAIGANVSSIMCSYNEVNDKYSCGNANTLTKILRDEVQFKGFVTSDWGANHAATFINDGLDMEMPGTVGGGRPRETYFTHLKSEVESGEVTEATIDRAVAHILLQMERFGLLDGRPERPIGPSPIAENAPVVEKTAEDAAVLLKDDDHALPLKASDLDSLALIGPGAGQTIAVGEPGEKAVGLPAREIGTFAALRKDTGGMTGVHITYAVADDRTGAAIPAQYFSHDGKPGLERKTAEGATETDAQINFTHSNGKALPADSQATWSGVLSIPQAGAYVLHMEILGAYGELTLDGKTVAHNGKMFVHGDITQAGESDVLPTTDGLDNVGATLNLAAGPHPISLTVKPDTSRNPVQVRLSWLTPEQKQADHEAAVDAARAAKTAIVFVWAQGDPKFNISADQDKLVEDVAAANPNTIVVLNVSQPVALPWLDKVKAVLQMWWPGDEGGWATANVLLGKANPAGRLPFTWGHSLADYPATDPAHPERRGDNAGGTGVFSEGIFVGYRWFDKQGIEPLFPFGFGLSYTHFEYSHLHVSPTADGGVTVSFEVKNAGPVAGDEVPQVYVGAPAQEPGGAQFAVRALAAFERVSLSPGQAKTVTLEAPARSFQYWSVAAGRWMTAAGPRTIYVGRSSRDLPLQAVTNIA
jgi:beta-glucosidase